MPSLREQILARVLVVLQGAPTGAVTVSRSREVAIARANSPAIVIMPVNGDATRIASNADKMQLEFAVEIFVRGDPWDSLADPIDVAAHAALFSDATLASLLADLRRVGEAFEGQEADRTAGTLTARYRATYLTKADAIDRAA